MPTDKILEVQMSASVSGRLVAPDGGLEMLHAFVDPTFALAPDATDPNLYSFEFSS
jgi:hypothetical protein